LSVPQSGGQDTVSDKSRYPMTFRSDASLVAPSVLVDDMALLESPSSPRSNQPLNRFAWRRLLGSGVGPTEAAVLDERLMYPNNLKSTTSKIADSRAVGCNNPSLPRDIEAFEQAKVLGLLPHAVREDIWGGDYSRASFDHTATANGSAARIEWVGDPFGHGIGKRSSYGSINIPLPSVG
jgi:hypothetical protein